MERKKSFMIYFDALPAIADLSSAQRGELFSALFDYAMRVCDRPVDPHLAIADYPALEGGARMAFFFMAGCVARDTVKWRTTQERRQKATGERSREKKTEKSGDDGAWMDAFIQ